MKEGFFSHRLCYRHSLYSQHIIYFDSRCRVDAVEPFQQESPMTRFCEGILMAVAIDFVSHEEAFCGELRRQLIDNPSLSVGEAVLQNKFYAQYLADKAMPCVLYAIPSVDWSTGRLRGDGVKLVRVV